MTKGKSNIRMQVNGCDVVGERGRIYGSETRIEKEGKIGVVEGEGTK